MGMEMMVFWAVLLWKLVDSTTLKDDLICQTAVLILKLSASQNTKILHFFLSKIHFIVTHCVHFFFA